MSLPGRPFLRGTGKRVTLTGDNPFLPAPARILRVRELVPDVRLFDLRLSDAALADEFRWMPGQFVMLSILGVGEAPFSMPSSPARRGMFQLAIRRVGTLTDYLFDHVREGDTVGIRGPLGKGFPAERFVGQDVVLIAGGLGMVPLRGLLHYLIDLRERFGQIVLLYGARSPDQVLFRDELESVRRRGDARVFLTVEEPGGADWTGRVGRVTELLDEIELDLGRTFAAVCGPPVFYKFVTDRLSDRRLAKDRIFLNLERRMECGVGKCGHCAVGYTFTCVHGPVFSFWDAINLPELIYD